MRLSARDVMEFSAYFALFKIYIITNKKGLVIRPKSTKKNVAILTTGRKL